MPGYRAAADGKMPMGPRAAAAGAGEEAELMGLAREAASEARPEAWH